MVAHSAEAYVVGVRFAFATSDLWWPINAQSFRLGSTPVYVFFRFCPVVRLIDVWQYIGKVTEIGDLNCPIAVIQVLVSNKKISAKKIIA